jgi:hypothetical protein
VVASFQQRQPRGGFTALASIFLGFGLGDPDEFPGCSGIPFANCDSLQNPQSEGVKKHRTTVRFVTGLNNAERMTA